MDRYVHQLRNFSSALCYFFLLLLLLLKDQTPRVQSQDKINNFINIMFLSFLHSLSGLSWKFVEFRTNTRVT